jgi:hypothetical protein
MSGLSENGFDFMPIRLIDDGYRYEHRRKEYVDLIHKNYVSNSPVTKDQYRRILMEEVAFYPKQPFRRDLYETTPKPREEEDISAMNIDFNSSDQRQIDEAVREAIMKPLREAEMAKRVAAVKAIGDLSEHPTGTVLRWQREENNKQTTLYVAVKAAENSWLVVTAMPERESYTYPRTDATLVEFLTSGPNMAQNLQVADSFTDIF